MKSAENNQVDRLLRSLAGNPRQKRGGRGASGVGSENQIVSEHLDIDELNSYAEGVVPAPSRSRYIEHLADCERCRRIVVGLSQTVGATRQLDLTEHVRVKFLDKIARVFTAPVLRYAVPALTLTLVIAIGLFALRPHRADLVAQNEPTNSAVAPTEPPQTESRPTDGFPSKQTNTLPSATDSTREKRDRPADKIGLTPTAPAGSGSGEIVSSLKDSPQPKSVAAAKFPSYAPEPPPPTPVSPFLQPSNETDRLQSAEKTESAARIEEERGRDQTQKEFGSANASPSPAASAVNNLGTRTVGGLGTASKDMRSDAKNKKETKDESETRTVSGRRFRRRGNAWVDTAYESTGEIINVARGSEHFRSLVADEPGIRAIAARLGGEVIVVWNGKAYRIH